MDRIFRLLLVDDEPHVTGALSLQLEAREDMDVYIANSAAETLNVLRKTRIDLMVSDIRMPGMTGLELLSRVQKEQPDCKVILLTGYADFKEPLINHRYFITIDKSVRESSLSRAFSGFGFPVIRS